MNLDAALQTFLEEARDLLQAMEDALLGIENGGGDGDTVNAMFRAAHTIKGSAGLFGLDAVVSFTHTVENVLDRVRAGELGITGELVSLLLSCRDHIGGLIERVAQGAELPGELAPAGEELLTALRRQLGQTEAPPARDLAVPPSVLTESEVESSGGGPVGPDHWHLSLRFGTEVLRNGMDPLSFLRYLGTLGELIHVSTLVDGLPKTAELDPERCYLGFEIDLKSDSDKQTLENVFEFVREDASIRILPPHARIEDYIALIRELPEASLMLGELLIRGGVLTELELQAALDRQRVDQRQQDKRPLGEILVEEKVVAAPVIKAALDKQKQMEDKRAQEHKFIKVEAAKLDHLINLVGELVIAGASTNLLAARAKNSELIEATSTLSTLVEQIRDGALTLRMVQIGETFNRFPRVVRDVSKELGKAIELRISGGETELDKSMVEKIGDPLMHLIRNAIDHGIENAETRSQRGKAETGSVELSAHHESGSIVIEVKDDGGGLKRDKIHAKAVEKGLIAAEQVLGDGEVYALIMEPGFSTADRVSNLSGRGVGMDVVKKNITALRGSIEIESEEGQGSTFRIRLPLTLAIIDGFLVRVGGSDFVLPLDMVVECVELGQVDAQSSRHYVNLRGEVLPFVRLRELFESEGEHPKRENVVVVQYGANRAGLVVDELLGEFQTVIKPLGSLFRNVKGIGGSTILGSGEVALILDVPELVGLAGRHEVREAAHHG